MHPACWIVLVHRNGEPPSRVNLMPQMNTSNTVTHQNKRNVNNKK
jgi:hypothetical protein